MALLGACDDHVPRQEPDELAPTEACPLGAAETVEEAEARTAELLQCLGHDPEQVAIECDVTTDWFYLDRVTIREDGWTVGSDTIGCLIRAGEEATVYSFDAGRRRIPESPYRGAEMSSSPDDVLDSQNPEARRCRSAIDPNLATYLHSDDLEEAARALSQFMLCGSHQEGEFDHYCWGPIRDSSEYPDFVIFVCRIDSHRYRESLLFFEFVGPPPS
ncbi:MAG: hypothetical protein H6706_16605 [Myxococcales bacterium]|nr:hypothetical protein [Myxococcales bacterium]